MTHGTPRRDFLLGRAAADCRSDVRQGAKTPADEPCLVHLSRKAMAGEFEICLPAAIAGEATAVALEALDLVQSLEGQLSYFRPDSDISQINREAADTPVDVEPRLFSLLKTAMQLWRESRGAYDLTATPLWEAWGFARREGSIPSPEQLAQARDLVGGQWVELDEERKTIRFLRRGVRLNLGSIGKGYAVDRAVEHLLAAGVSDFLVHGGFSSIAARGLASVRQPDVPWTIGVKDPLRDQQRLGQIELHDRALGTSGSQFQSFRHRGRCFGHILDPRSGLPSEGLLSVSVLAPEAAAADALSTAFYVMGVEAALDYCRHRPEIAAMLFSATDNGWELHRCGLAAESADLLRQIREGGKS